MECPTARADTVVAIVTEEAGVDPRVLVVILQTKHLRLPKVTAVITVKRRYQDSNTSSMPDSDRVLLHSPPTRFSIPSGNLHA